MDFSFFIANAQGFIAVAIAGAIFYMGRLNGRRVGAVAAVQAQLAVTGEAALEIGDNPAIIGLAVCFIDAEELVPLSELIGVDGDLFGCLERTILAAVNRVLFPLLVAGIVKVVVISVGH